MTSTIVLYCLLLIKNQSSFGNPKVILESKCLPDRAIWNKANEWVCQKYKDKKCNFFFKSEMFSMINTQNKSNTHLFNCSLEWRFDASFIFYFHNEKTSPVFRWTGRILGQNDTKEVNTCTSDDFDPEFCESRGYVLLSSISHPTRNALTIDL